jgi:hypothetical protein
MLSACGENPCQQERIESHFSNIQRATWTGTALLAHSKPYKVLAALTARLWRLEPISAAVKKIAAHGAVVAKQRNKLNEIRL